MHVVIDADQLIYAAGFASEGEPRSHTYKLLNNKLDYILKNTKADTHTVYLGGVGNFRESVAITQGYKANRVAPKPESYDDARQFLVRNRGAILVDGMEVDDQVSIDLYADYLLANGDPDECQVILSSPDKDLNNTPGWHYNPMKDTMRFINEIQATRHFWYQMLTGDTTDNIKGLPYCAEATRELHSLSKASAKGCGKVSAQKIMSGSSDIAGAISSVAESYLAWGVENGIDQEAVFEYMEEQGQLLWMVRQVDDFGSPIMFSLAEQLDMAGIPICLK